MSEITIQHNVHIDRCIEKEILRLNNKHNILTLYSCCGHYKDQEGYIVVHEFSEHEMVKLGYKKNGKFTTFANGHKNTYSTFKPKSICTGSCDEWSKWSK